MQLLNYCLMIASNGEWAVSRTSAKVSMPIKLYLESIGDYIWVVAPAEFIDVNKYWQKAKLNPSIEQMMDKHFANNLDRVAILDWVDFNRAKYLR